MVGRGDSRSGDRTLRKEEKRDHLSRCSEEGL